MVGPGEVDEELEPEVKEECEGKYGEIVKVQILEVPNVSDVETVRIFLEFKRVESAIKGILFVIIPEKSSTEVPNASWCLSNNSYISCNIVLFQLLLILMEDSLVEEKFVQAFMTLSLFSRVIC